MDMSRIISRKDLALYVVVLALSECDRAQIKSRIMVNPMIKQIMEAYPDASSIFEDFLNLRFESF